MPLTPPLSLAQKQSLKAMILADGALSALVGDPGALAAALNAEASPAFVAWKTRLAKYDATDLVSPTGTAFAWGGTTGGYINRSQGERDCWRELWNSALACNPSLPNVRTAFADIFSGAGAGAQNNRAHLLAMSTRRASVVEKHFASGNGAAPTALTDAGTMFVVEGAIRAQDLAEILAS